MEELVNESAAFDANVSIEEFECMLRHPSDDHGRNHFSFMMYGVLLNLVCVVGLAGNVISIIVLSR